MLDLELAYLRDANRRNAKSGGLCGNDQSILDL